MASNKPSSLGIKLSNKMTLSGHKAPITCLSVNPSESLLASGSEDNTLRIWDLSSKKCTKVCIPPKALFASGAQASPEAQSSDENEILAAAFLDDMTLIAAIGPALVVFSLASEDVIVSKTVAELNLEAGDVNTIEVVRSSANALVCGCDEAIVELEVLAQEGSVSLVKKAQKDAHSGAFVSTAKPLQRADSIHYVSGGFDCKVAYTNPASEPVAFDLSTPEVTSGNVKQMFNPPYIYSLDILENGPWVIAATGSGYLELLNVDLKVRGGSEEAHSSAINFVSFARFTIPGLPNLFISTGNDGFLAFRSVHPPNEANALKYADILQRQTDLQGRIAAAKKASKPQLKLLNTFATQLKQLQGAPKLELVHKTKLPSVVNWCCSTSKTTNSGNLFLADTTEVITCYTVSPSSS